MTCSTSPGRTPALLALALSCALTVIPGADAAPSSTPAPAADRTADRAKDDAADTQPDFAPWGIDLSAGDRSVRPGDNFYMFANGKWQQKATIPSDQSSTGTTINLDKQAERQVRALIERAADPHDASASTWGPGRDQVGALYRSYMDEDGIEQRGAAPLTALLAPLSAIQDRTALAAFMGKAHATFGGTFFGLYIGPDDKDPTRNSLTVTQNGLGLPSRDYYLNPAFAPVVAAYRDYIARTLTLIGWQQPATMADRIIAMETAIAKGSWSPVEQRNALKRYNPMSVAALQAFAPDFAWRPFLKEAGVADVDTVVVAEKSAMPAIAAVFAATDLDTLKAWEAVQLTGQASSFLPRAFVDNLFALEKALTGVEDQKPRWRRAVGYVNHALGDLVGQAYVAAHFPPRYKSEMEQLVGNLKSAMGGRIARLQWMGPATREQALHKLDRMRVMVGYPDKWRDYTGLELHADDLLGNAERVSQFEWAWRVSKLHQPVDPAEWQMTPQTVNAYADPSRNVIVFPAAILQAPYFDPAADSAVNYGAIGAIIGHEITHMFDDQGRHYDATGALRDWWTPADAKRFDAATAKLAAQYDTYEALPGLHVQGKLTLGENIADLGGLLIAHDAWRAATPNPAPVLSGFSGEQRFFLSWAQGNRSKVRDASLRERVARDAHSPAQFRVNGPVRNIDAWYDAYDVRPGQTLYLAPSDRVRIW